MSLRAAGYWNSGQECGSGCRVLVHQSVASEFVEHLSQAVGTLVVGEPAAGDDIELGPVVSKAHFDTVVGFLDRARGEGIRAVVGGSPIEDKGYFIPPTVFVDVPAGAECARDEIFGPVVTVENDHERR
jgi:aminobutyraldehyde dehydrogenase